MVDFWVVDFFLLSSYFSCKIKLWSITNYDSYLTHVCLKLRDGRHYIPLFFRLSTVFKIPQVASILTLVHTRQQPYFSSAVDFTILPARAPVWMDSPLCGRLVFAARWRVNFLVVDFSVVIIYSLAKIKLWSITNYERHLTPYVCLKLRDKHHIPLSFRLSTLYARLTPLNFKPKANLL